MDETGKLEYGQVYIKYTVREDPSGPQKEPQLGEDDEEADAIDDDKEDTPDEPETRVVEGQF